MVTSDISNNPANETIEIQMRLAGGIGISLINGVPEELVFATFNPIEASKIINICIVDKRKFNTFCISDGLCE